MWIKYLANEGRNIARSAEKAEEAGDYSLARKLYLKAVAKFKEASELGGNSNEIYIVRDLANYYNNRALKLERELGKPIMKPKKETSELLVSEVLKGTEISEKIFETVLKIAIEISTEGREGRAVGTAFIIGDTANVMAKSRQLVLNPFEGHKREERLITEAETLNNIKEFAQLDGVFVISGDGVVEAAGRYITIDTGVAKIPRGLGTRHSSVAAITSVTGAIGIVVSQSGGIIRVFRDGKIAATVKP
ncbi:MAG: diadenylate cyclase [Candidatus Methanoperedens sp.]|nr:diadenylate cyclase [Candidatus Methanoperedens sp.]